MLPSRRGEEGEDGAMSPTIDLLNSTAADATGELVTLLTSSLISLIAGVLALKGPPIGEFLTHSQVL